MSTKGIEKKAKQVAVVTTMALVGIFVLKSIANRWAPAQTVLNKVNTGI